jgi:hypothetical protein
MNIGCFKIPADRREWLVQIYLEGGQKAVEPLCRELGVSPKYAANLAAAMGLHRHKDNGTPTSTRSADDPRWARAIAVGRVIA